MNAKAKSIGFIGLGRMGAPMARRLIGEADLQVFDLNSTTVSALMAAGAKGADDVSALADECGIIFLSLPTVASVTETIAMIAAERSPPRIVVDLSTTGPK